MTSFILSLFEITLTMSAVIILLLILSSIFGKRFSAKCRYIIWAIVILRLCIPIGTPLIPPLFTYEIPNEDFYVEEKIETPVTPSVPNDSPITNTPIVNPPVTSTPSIDTPQTNIPTTPDVPFTPSTPSTPNAPITEPEPTAPAPSISVADMLFVLGIVWTSVAALYFAFRLTVHVIYVASISKSKTLPSPMLSSFYHNICDKRGIKRAPKLYVSASVTSPMLLGYLSPCIILPNVKFNDIELEGILSHELTHYRRGDLWIKLLSLFATSLHWFNPFVHIAAVRLAQETELSCDEAVLSGCDDETRRIYAEAVLSVIRRNCHKNIALTTHFNPKKSAVKERFKAILDSTKKRRGRVIIAAVLVLCIIAGAVIGCSFSDDEPTVYLDPIASEFKSSGKLPDDIDNAVFEVRPIGSDTTICYFGDSLSYYLLGATNDATRYKLSIPDGYTNASIIFISPGAGSGEAIFTVSAKHDGKTEYLSYLFSFGDSRNMPISISTLTKTERKVIDKQIAAYTPPARVEKYEAGQSNVDFSAQLPEDIEKNYPYTTIGNYSFHMYESGRSYYVYDKVKGSTIKTTLSLPVDFSGAEILFIQSARNGEDLEIFVTASHKTMHYVILKYNISADSQYRYHTEISLVDQSEHDAIYNAKEKYSEEARIFKEKQDDPIPSVLAGTVNMYMDGNSPMLPHWLRDNGFHITKYVLTDLDGNGINEAVLSLGAGTNEYYGYLVLHTYKREAFAELFTYRQFMSLKEDGRFSFSSGVSSTGVGKLAFANGKCTTLVLAHHENKNYFIGESAVSADEYNKYINEHYQTNDVTWHTVDQSTPAKTVTRSYRLSVDVSVSLNIPSSWYRDESMNSHIWLDEAKPFNFVSNDYSFFNDTIKRVMIHGDANDFDELKKQLEADTTYKYSFDSPMVGLTDSGYKYEGVYANMTASRRYIFRISTGKDIYHLEIREWTAYDSDSFLEDVVIPIVKSFTVTYEDAGVITDIADWDKLPWIEEQSGSFKRAHNAYNLINDLVSGESNIPEYNELGIKDYSVTLLENSSYGSALQFTFTVTGNSLPETLPPGTHTKILYDGIDVFVYDSYEEYKAHTQDNYNLGSFANNTAVGAVHTYLCYMPYIWEISPHGEWDPDNVHLPYNYIAAFYGNENIEIEFSKLQKLMNEKFGITIEKPTESCYLSRCRYDKETNTVYYADTRGYEPIHRILDYKAVDGTAYVTVQLYADRNYLLPSHKVTYRIGADEVFLDFEITEKGKYEPNSLR